MNVIQKYYVANFRTEGPVQFVPKLVCTDGFKMSVQASYTHYSKPRENLEDGGYSSWEVGFPTERVEDLMPYIDGPDDDPTGIVYGYVPTDIINKVIADHGGIKGKS